MNLLTETCQHHGTGNGIDTMTDKNADVIIYRRIIKRLGYRFILMCIDGISAHDFTFDYWWIISVNNLTI